MSYTYSYSLNPNYISRFIIPKQRAGYAQIYEEEETKENKSLQNLNKGFKKNKGLSKNSIRKIKEAIGWLEYIALPKVYITKNKRKIPFKIQMITLTLSGRQRHGDKYITKNMLGKMLNNLRNNYNLKNYIWRAEKQKNGRIHYHIVTDCGIGYFTVLKMWNKIQEKEGYLKEFRDKYKKDWPNSVDIKRINHHTEGAQYIAKYNSKELAKGQEIEGRFYSLSESLSHFKEFKQQTRDIANYLKYHWQIDPRKWKEINEYVSIYPVKIESLTSSGEWKEMKAEIKEKLKEICDLTPSQIKGNWVKNGAQIILEFPREYTV